MKTSTWLWIAGGVSVGAVLAGGGVAMASPGPSEGEGGTPPAPPPPPGGRETGTQFAARVASLQGAARDRAALGAAAAGNTPTGWGVLVPVPVRGGGLTGTVFVTPDFFGVGVDGDWVRWPLLPASAQLLADAHNAVLPTKKIADAVQATATKLRMYPSNTNRDATATYVDTNARIERARGSAPPATLFDGQKKNILAADAAHPSSIIIYGGNNPDTMAWPLQPYSWVHDRAYRDYSHGVRLVGRRMLVDGRGEMDIADVLRDPVLASLVSDRAGDRGARY